MSDMRIDYSAVDLAAAHSAFDSVELRQRLEIRASSAATAPSAAGPSAPSSKSPQDSVEIADLKVLLAKFVFEFFTGHRAPAVRPLHLNSPPSVQVSTPESAPAPSSPAQPWGISYTRTEIRREAESSVFSAQGSVTLDTGAKIDFSLDLQMNREMTAINGVAVRAGNMSDPIVVNLDGSGARLTAASQPFDLNGDGVKEAIATLAAGSAWLARDGNGNGQIDNGRELFGPRSGSGFTELGALDQDHNGWIDEGDAAYNQMGIWDSSKFTSLRDAGIGALSVSAIATPFALNDGANQLGQIRQSGVYLKQDGSPGALQQVDLKV